MKGEITHEKQVPVTCTLRVCWEFRWNLQGKVSREQFEALPRDVGTNLTTLIIVGRRTVIEFYHSEEQRPALRWFVRVLKDPFYISWCVWSVNLQSYCTVNKYSSRKVSSRTWFWLIYRITSFRRRSRWGDSHGRDVFSRQNDKQTCLDWRWGDRNKDTSQ